MKHFVIVLTHAGVVTGKQFTCQHVWKTTPCNQARLAKKKKDRAELEAVENYKGK